MNYLLKSLQDKGKIVYEYNPLKNLYKNGKLSDFITDQAKEGLNFDLSHPVDIICQPSYDGSVNLILNDNKNAPKLINSRFSTLQNNTYEIVDRTGERDTNLYDINTLNLDTSLYKKVQSMPSIQLYEVLQGGNLKVGNYIFYIKYADADDNETDFVAESGIVACFVGSDSIPSSINGGYRDYNSNKMVQLKINNVDKAYDYIKVYYVRSTSDIDENIYKTAYKICQKYPINSSSTYITITGNEDIQDIQLSDLNLKYFIASTVKTQAAAQNRLYFGNITQESTNIEDLQDASLRIIPYIQAQPSEQLIGDLNAYYKDISSKASNKCMYYNTKNIYNYVGYWPEEIYRFGIVYIMADGTLSSVFNVLGIRNNIKNSEEESKELSMPLYKEDDYGIQTRNKLPVSEDAYQVSLDIHSDVYNSKGVVNLPDTWFVNDRKSILSINFYMPQELIQYLKETYSIQGWFFVRQRRIPTILAQGWTIPIDKEACVPGIYSKENNIQVEGFLNKNRSLVHDYKSRLHEGNISKQHCAMICPEYEIAQPFYNQVFTGQEFYIKSIATSGTNCFSPQTVSQRLYGINTLAPTYNKQYSVKIASVYDSAPVVVIDDCVFRGQAGNEADALKFRYIGSENKDTKEYKYVRGLFGPYLGVVGNIDLCTLYNIYVPGYAKSKMSLYFKTRYEDNSEFLAISDRFKIEKYLQKDQSFKCFRGDCYQSNFTHRLNRNFQDSTAQTNDIIIDQNTWKDNYDVDDATKSAKINRGDVNAIKMGSWYTVPVWASKNISIRSTDLSYPSEEGLFGHPRTFYPLSSLSAEGESKIPESFVHNAGFDVSVGERWNYVLPEAPYYKNNFQTRIAYSDLVVGDSFKNGFRVFQSTNFQDYSREYGGLIKLVEKSGNLIAVFEHAIALIPINERVAAGEGAGGELFINTNNVLPENPVIISDMYGSQWADSVIKTDRFVYGVDTVAKKIWKTDGQSVFDLISDIKVSRFLNENISLSETEFTPIIGVRNVKTHYNAFKGDVMFTFYDTTKGINEVSWNLCYNEPKNMFVTFYSWIPSFSESIDNIYFSFDRDTSKYYSRLAISTHGNADSYGVTIQNVQENKLPTVIYNHKTKFNLFVDDSVALNYDKTYFKFQLLKDPWGFYKYFEIKEDVLQFKDIVNYLDFKKLADQLDHQVYLKIKGEVYIDSIYDQNVTQNKVVGNEITTVKFGEYTNIIALRLNNIDNTGNIIYELPTTAFYKHGQAGLFDDCEKIKPTFWYGKQHPFEFEVIVADSPSMHKIFNNIQIMSNKAEPESFHYEVVGEVYDWAWDKKNMYYRQEETKCLLQNLGSNISYDYKYLEESKNYSDYFPQQKILEGNTYVKSTMFPLIYERQKSLNKIQDEYNEVNVNETYNSWIIWNSKEGLSRDYMHLSGAEISYDNLLGEYKVWNHSKGVNAKKYGRLRGNMEYKEDMWDIQINSLIFVQKNESKWPNDIPPIYIVGSLPNDITQSQVDLDENGNIVQLSESEIPNATFATGSWGNRKETRMRDKYIRIRVRYSGKELALINSLITKYTISYA